MKSAEFVDAVYAFEWTTSIHESAYEVLSLHLTLTGAYKQMKEEIFHRWQRDRDDALVYGSKHAPLSHEQWRIRKIHINQ